MAKAKSKSNAKKEILVSTVTPDGMLTFADSIKPGGNVLEANMSKFKLSNYDISTSGKALKADIHDAKGKELFAGRYIALSALRGLIGKKDVKMNLKGRYFITDDKGWIQEYKD